MITLYLIGHCQNFSFGFTEFDQMRSVWWMELLKRLIVKYGGNEGIIATLSLQVSAPPTPKDCDLQWIQEALQTNQDDMLKHI